MPLARKRQRQPEDSEEDDNDNNSDEPGQDADTTVEGGATQGSIVNQLVKKLVRLALACEFSRQPIRRADISTKGWFEYYAGLSVSVSFGCSLTST
jgi:hypothetical protein